MNSFVYPGELNIITKAANQNARSTATAASQCNHLRVRPFSDTACRAATAPEIDKILLPG
jgi:hypothetical protein